MFNGQTGGWAWYPSNSSTTHLALPPTSVTVETPTNLSGPIIREDIQKRGKKIFWIIFFYVKMLSPAYSIV